MLSEIVKNYFGFNRQQRNGLFVLMLISFLLLLARLTLPYIIQPDDIVIKDLPLFEARLDSAFKTETAGRHLFTNKNTRKLFPFDPNTVTPEQLLQLGFSDKKAKIFIRFRNSGFIFREKSDLLKVFGVPGYLYNTLEPYITIAPRVVTQTTVTVGTHINKENKPVKKPVLIELNSADSATLVELNGIGGVFARRIIKYREVLGGYADPEQLKEVYGFTNELFEKVKPFVSADPGKLKKIDLNHDDFKSINKHPYLSYEMTKNIFNYRRKTPITAENLNEILNDPALCKKLSPYLNFE